MIKKTLTRRSFMKKSMDKEKGKDRRVRLSKDDKVEIRKLYKTWSYTYKHLAFRYGVVISTIFCVIHPDIYQKHLKARREWWKTNKDRYSRSYMNSAGRATRLWKANLYKRYILNIQNIKLNIWKKLTIRLNI